MFKIALNIKIVKKCAKSDNFEHYDNFELLKHSQHLNNFNDFNNFKKLNNLKNLNILNYLKNFKSLNNLNSNLPLINLYKLNFGKFLENNCVLKKVGSRRISCHKKNFRKIFDIITPLPFCGIFKIFLCQIFSECPERKKSKKIFDPPTTLD